MTKQMCQAVRRLPSTWGVSKIRQSSLWHSWQPKGEHVSVRFLLQHINLFFENIQNRHLRFPFPSKLKAPSVFQALTLNRWIFGWICISEGFRSRVTGIKTRFLDNCGSSRGLTEVRNILKVCVEVQEEAELFQRQSSLAPVLWDKFHLH